MNINLQYLLLCICTFCIKSNRSQCTLDMECHFFDWLSWSPCTGTCGLQTRYTDRYMCCSIQQATVETCLRSCNKSINFPMHRTQSCRICENGGTVEPASLSCRCGPHYKGGCCQDVVTCRDHPCKHGTCTDQGASFLCTCDEKYTGVTCDSRDCSREPECHVFDWEEWGSCTGACGSQSQQRERKMCCSTSVSPHSVENCLRHCNLPLSFELHESKSCRICGNGGTLNITSLSCKCDLYHKGDCCKDVLNCQDNPCKHGNCTDIASTFTCNCARGYQGPICETKKNCSQGTLCDNGGTCVDGSIGFKCQCRVGYTGDFCDKVLITAEASELRLPEWIQYLEYGVLSMVSLIGFMTLGCACLKCSRACGSSDNKDGEDNDEEKDLRKKRRIVHFSQSHSKPKAMGIDF